MKTLALPLIAALSVSCSRGANEDSPRETVLSQGQTIEATNKNGKIKITYVSPLRRKYQWNGQERVVTLIPRQEPFDGRLGLYQPADSWILGLRKTRLVLDEAIRNFDSNEKAIDALVESRGYMDWVYTSDGLVVGFGQTPSRKQVNINVFQFLVRGRKPANLLGSRPQQIEIRFADSDG
jgi:hypothetical protein